MAADTIPTLQTGWTSNLFNMTEADALQGDFVSTVFIGGHIGAASLGLHVATFTAAIFPLRKIKNTGVCLRVLALAWKYDDGTPNSTFHYFMSKQSSHLNGAAITSAFFSTLLADSFLFLRCFRWWNDDFRAFLMYSTPFWFSISYVLSTAVFSAGHATELYSIWVMPIYAHWPTGIATVLFATAHIVFTAIIASRTVITARAANRPRPTLGSIIIESALPYCIALLVFMILYCANVMAANALISLLVQLQGIAVNLIVIRMQCKDPSALLPVHLSAPYSAVASGPVFPLDQLSGTSFTKPEASKSKSEVLMADE